MERKLITPQSLFWVADGGFIACTGVAATTSARGQRTVSEKPFKAAPQYVLQKNIFFFLQACLRRCGVFFRLAWCGCLLLFFNTSASFLWVRAEWGIRRLRNRKPPRRQRLHFGKLILDGVNLCRHETKAEMILKHAHSGHLRTKQ